MEDHEEKFFEFDGKGLVLDNPYKTAAYVSILEYYKKKGMLYVLDFVILGRQIRPKSNQRKTT